MKKQIWFCLKCRHCGEVEHEEHADVLTVVELIRGQHSEFCTADPRVLNDIDTRILAKLAALEAIEPHTEAINVQINTLRWAVGL